MTLPLVSHEVPSPEQLHDMQRRHEAAIKQLTEAMLHAQLDISKPQSEVIDLKKRFAASQPSAVSQ